MTQELLTKITGFNSMDEVEVEIHAVKKAGESVLHVELEGRNDVLAWAINKILEALAMKMGWTMENVMHRINLARYMTEIMKDEGGS